MDTKGQVATQTFSETKNELCDSSQIKEIVTDLIDNVTETEEKVKQIFISKVGANQSSTWFVYGSVNPYQYPDNCRKELFKCIHDPGAMATILSKHVYDALPQSAKPILHKSDLKVYGANGHPIHLYGQCNLALEINGKIYYHDTIVCDLQDDIILGSDFIYDAHTCETYIESLSSMRKTKSKRRKMIWIIDPDIPDRINKVQMHTYRPTHKGINLLTINRITLQPGQEYFVRTRADDYVTDDKLYMITNANVEPDKPNLNKLQVANSISWPEKGEAIVRITNVNTQKVTLDEGTSIAKMDELNKCYISKQINDIRPPTTTDSESEQLESIGKKRIRRKRTKNIRIRQIQVNKDPNLLELPEYLHDLYNRSAENLNIQQRNRLKNVLIKTKKYFATSDDDYGYTDKVEHDIDTGDVPPIRQKCRPPAHALRDIEDEEIEKMLKNDQIEPSNSPWASPVVLVKKKDGSTRFCIDYRKLNAVTIKDAYPLPNIQDCINTLQDGKYFCTIDLKSGYWHVRMSQRAAERSAFVCRQGLFQWKVMPFGLCNAPATFERLMETVLKGHQWKTCLVYLDDVIIFGNTFEQCAKRTEEIITCLGEAGLKLKAKKCILFQERVAFLGHIISAKGVETDPDKVTQIKNWPRPKEGLRLGARKIPFVTQIKQFLGICSYYRKFIPKFAVIAEPLQVYTRDGADLTWTPEAEIAFNRLKECLVTSPILAYPQRGKRYYIDTDACNFAMGAVLSQLDENGKEHPIIYMSKTFSGAERNYCIWRKEFISCVKALKTFEPYIIGQDVILRTDNIAVTRMMKMEQLSPQSANLVAYVDQLGVKIVHRKGKEHVVPDVLSRKPENYNELVDSHRCKQCTPGSEGKVSVETQTEPNEDSIKVNRVQTRTMTRHGDDPDNINLYIEGWQQDKFQEAMEKDIDMKTFRKHKSDNPDKRPDFNSISGCSYHFKVMWGDWNSFYIKNNLIYRDRLKNDIPHTQLVLPREFRRKAFDQLHNTPFGGHVGYRKTLGKIKDRFYWPRMQADIKLWTQQCDACYINKPLNRNTHTRLQLLLTGHEMERSACDIAGPLPKTSRKNRYIMVVGDYFTKWIEAIPLPDYKAKTCADALLNHFIYRLGIPLSLHTDQGKSFQSALWRELCLRLGMKKTQTTSYRPQSDGFVEKFNATMWMMLKPTLQTLKEAKEEAEKEEKRTGKKKPFVNRNPEWDELVPVLAMAYRASPQESTGISPNLAMLGREINLPVDLVLPKYEEIPQNMPDYVQKLQANMQQIHDIVRRNTEWSMNRRKRYYDQHAFTKKSFKPFDKVWWNTHDRNKDNLPSKKLTPLRKGPFLIEKQIGDCKFYVRTSRNCAKVIHEDKLLPYKGTAQPGWMTTAINKLYKKMMNANGVNTAQQWDNDDFQKYLNPEQNNDSN